MTELTASAVKINRIPVGNLTLNPKKFQLLPDLGADDLTALRADIEANGIKVPIEVDTEGNVLDGFNRVTIAKALKLESVPAIVRRFDTDTEREAHVLRINVQRRHLNQAQKRTLLKKYLALNPEKSNRQIASEVGVDDKTVGTVRSEEEAAGTLPKTATRKGKDGKSRPATTKRTAGTKGKPNAERALKDAIASQSRAIRTGLVEAAGQIEKGLTPEQFVGSLVKTQPDAVRAALAVVLPFLQKVEALQSSEPF